MIEVAGFEGAEDADLGDVGGAEVAIVVDLFDAGASGGEDSSEAGEGAGAVGDLGADAAEAAVGGQASFDDARQQGDVDIAAGEQEDDFLAGKVEGTSLHGGGKGDGGGAFDDGLFQFEETEDGLGNLGFVDEHEMIEDFFGDLETEDTDLPDGQAVSECRSGGDADRKITIERDFEGGGGCGFDADDLNGGFERFDGGTDAGEEPAAADGDEDGVKVGKLFEEFQANSALAGDDVGVVETRDEGEMSIGRELLGIVIRVIERVALLDNLGTE